MRETIEEAASAFSEFDYVEYNVETYILRYLRGGAFTCGLIRSNGCRRSPCGEAGWGSSDRDGSRSGTRLHPSASC